MNQMSMPVNELRSMIRTRFQSEAEFARVMGWSRQKMNKITTRKQLPDIAELNKMAKMLDVGIPDLLRAFLPEQEPKQKENALQEMERKRSDQIQLQMKCRLARCEGKFLTALEHTFELHGLGGDGQLYSGARYGYDFKIPQSGCVRQGRLAIIFEFVPDDK
jgi:transcriptional regulator with XRE-family HTH domain